MDRIIRSGVDVEVALKHTHIRSDRLQAADSLHLDSVETETSAPSFSLRRKTRSVVRSWIKRAFHLGLPALRPVVRRARGLVAAEVSAQTRPEFQHGYAVAGQYADRASEEMKAQTALLIRVTQRAQDVLQRTLDDAALREHAVQASFDGALAAEAARHAASEVEVATLRSMLVSLSEKVDTLGKQSSVLSQHAYVAARRSAVPVSDGAILVRTESGYVLVDADDHAVLMALVDSGDLEPGTRLVISRLVKPGDTFIDVGANVGVHTLCAAHAMRGNGRVIAFEPFPRTSELLKRTVTMNGLASICTVRQEAVSDQPGEKDLYVGLVSAHHSLIELDNLVSASSPPVNVPVVRLDDVISLLDRVDLIKIDVEGMELEVLNGARRIVSENPNLAIIAEFGPSHLQRSGHSAADWLDTFTKLGFDRRVIDPVTGLLSTASVEELSDVESTNLLFAAAQSPVWERLTDER
jgi:FkbM family methyltransferase